MGQTNSTSRSRRLVKSRTPPHPNYDLPALRFHLQHGDNIALSPDKSRAVRADSFCKGIVFSNRPVMVGERVCIRLTALSDRWKGILRVGFSAHDPASLASPLPKYACPDLTSKDGFWAKALSERCVTDVDTLIHYFVAANGDVHFGFNGNDLGVFFSGVDTRTPLWAMIDLYGNCTSIEFIDVRRGINNYLENQDPSSGDGNRDQPVLLPVQLPVQLPVPVTALPSQYHQMPPPPLTVELPASNPSNVLENHPQVNGHTQSSGNLCRTLDNLKAHAGIRFHPLSFHPGVGRNAKIVDNQTACRLKDEFSQGYVFAWPQIRVGERIVIQVLAIEQTYIGSLAFGLTNCDPSVIDVRELPEDSDLLLDRPEYWVVSKDVANYPEVGDELSFQVNPDGSVEFSKNGNIPSTFMHVDTSLPLWAFWDIYGTTSKIRLLGSTSQPCVRSSASSLPAFNSGTNTSDIMNTSMSSNGPGECNVCYENTIDCVLYTCGHMCMCYDCAFQQWKGRGHGICPICRSAIKDVIKTFRS